MDCGVTVVSEVVADMRVRASRRGNLRIGSSPVDRCGSGPAHGKRVSRPAGGYFQLPLMQRWADYLDDCA